MASTMILFGILTITLLIITVILGVLMHRGKPVFKYHRSFAFLTLISALIHATLVIYSYYF